MMSNVVENKINISKGYPSLSEARKLLDEGALLNPGPWISHSENVGLAAKLIASHTKDLDPQKAQILGILHDIGKRSEVCYIKHTYYGYHFLMDLGYKDAARIALTHSFYSKKIDTFLGKFDITEAEQKELQNLLDNVTFDDYDRLIILCDGLALPDKLTTIEERANDIKLRYGHYQEERKDNLFEQKSYFEKKMNKDLYDVLNIKC